MINPNALLEAVVSDCGNAEVGTAYSYACTRLQQRLLKKNATSRVATADKKAIANFVQRSAKPVMPLPSLFEARGWMIQTLGDLEEEEVAAGMRTGPGSVIKQPGSDPSTSGILKLLGRHGPTASSRDVAVEVLSLVAKYDPVLYSALAGMSQKIAIAPYNKLTTVPKDNSTDRVIAIEPTLNAYLQQGIRSVLENRLQLIGVDLATQPFENQRLARRGSIDGYLCTVDLSAASDSISRELVEALLPKQWAEYVLFASSPHTLIPSKYFGEAAVISGRICLSMGNAITFPLQTLIYLALAGQVMRQCGIEPRVNDNLAVFGDDIILPSSCFEKLEQLLEACGFTVNANKSFSQGPFRESCGADWYLGMNVTPVYIRGLASTPELFVARNMLAAFYYRWSVPGFSAIQLIDDELKRRRTFLFVPLSAPVDSGIRVKRVPKFLERCSETQAWKYRSYQRSTQYRSVRKLVDNRILQLFQIQAHLRGWVSGQDLLERPSTRRTRYRSVIRVHSNWCYVLPSDRWLYDLGHSTSGDTPSWRD